ncbi:MAG TPA: LicD family protein [Alphaproteobacteria bacterium]|nr:LicD family protein [Alphaproteobacteria bacterium]
MIKFIANIICMFLPNKKMRSNIRQYFRPGLDKKIDEIYANINYINKFLKITNPITEIPKATPESDIWLIQNGVLKLVELWSLVCKKFNWTWWVSGGNLIGVVRHSGFIPWDDDFDLEMPRKDFEEMIKILPIFLKNSNFLVFYRKKTWIKLIYKNYNSFIDIIPRDQYFKKILNNKDRENFKNNMLKMVQVTNYEHCLENDILINDSKQASENYFKTYSKNRNYHNKIIMENKPILNDGDWFVGSEMAFLAKNSWTNKPDTVVNICSHDIIFPIREMKFEYMMLPVPNNPTAFNEVQYGNVISWPNTIDCHTSKKLTNKNRDALRELIKLDINKVFEEINKRYESK